MNEARYSADTTAWGVSLKSGSMVGEKKDKNDPKSPVIATKPKFGYDQALYDPGLTASFPIRDDGGESSVTRSAIAPGSVVITDPARQEAISGLVAEAFLAALNRDTENAHDGPLADNPSLVKLLGDQKKQAQEIQQYVKYVQEAVEFLNENVINRVYVETDKKIKELKDEIEKLEEEKQHNAAKIDDLKTQIKNLEVILKDNKPTYDNWRTGGKYRIAIDVVATLAAVQYGGGETLDAFLGMAVGYLVSQNPALQEFARYVADKSSDVENTQNHTYDQIMEAFALAGAFDGDQSGAAAFLLAQPDQIQKKKLAEERKPKNEEKKTDEEEKKAENSI